MFEGEVSRGEVYFKRLRLEAIHLHLPVGCWLGWQGQNLPEDCGCEWYIHVDGGGT